MTVLFLSHTHNVSNHYQGVWLEPPNRLTKPRRDRPVFPLYLQTLRFLWPLKGTSVTLIKQEDAEIDGSENHDGDREQAYQPQYSFGGCVLIQFCTSDLLLQTIEHGNLLFHRIVATETARLKLARAR